MKNKVDSLFQNEFTDISYEFGLVKHHHNLDSLKKENVLFSTMVPSPFSLGCDESVSIERNQIEEFSEKNFFGNRVTETVGREIILRNAKSSPVSITVLDQVPVSTNEDINVDLQKRSNASYNEETGRISWDLELKPSESRTLRFVYEITYPAGKQLQRTQ